MPNRAVALARMIRPLDLLLRDESGTTAIEYAMIASLLSVAIVASVALMGDGLVNIWLQISSEVTTSLGR